MRSWAELLSDKNRAVGEVAGVEAGKIEVFVYPEFYPNIHVGSILLVDSENAKPVGLVLKLAHSTQHGQIMPLRKTRDELARIYPDIDRYYRYVCVMAYTSHLSGNRIVHVRASMPRLHDLVFVVNSDALLDLFLRPEGSWNFDFLRYYIAEGASSLELREFFYHHRDYFSRFGADRNSIVSKVARTLYLSGVSGIGRYVEDICAVLGWDYE